MSVPENLFTDEKDLFDAIQNQNREQALILIEKGVNVNCYDSSKMTPLSLAVYKGDIEIVEACLEKGANVNDKHHEHGYTPLMFAALSGKNEICKMLMDYGAKSFQTNNMGKTASELAAFVGQHECVSIINNHIGIDEIDSFLNTKEAGKTAEEFPEDLASFIHSLCKTHKIHPIALIFQFCDYKDAIKYQKKILYVIDRIFEKQLRNKESNELWIILFVMREVFKCVEEKKNVEPCEAALVYAKWILAWLPGSRTRVNLEKLLRTAINAFPYKHSLLYTTLTKALSTVPIGSLPTYDYIVQAIFGQRILACSKFCATCGTPNATKRCPTCKLHYCSQKCQKFDWPIHKKCCESIKEWNIPEQGDSFASLEDLQAHLANIDA